MTIKTPIILSIFVLGLLFIFSYKHEDLVKESFDITNKCPNLLIRKGKEIHLVNTRKALIPGVNPIKFDSLEDYSQFVRYQQHMKIGCPVLYYQETYDTQNNKGFRLHTDPIDPEAGLPSHIAKEYNINNIEILAKGGDYIDTKKLKRKPTFKTDKTKHLKQVHPQDFSIEHSDFTQPMDTQDQTVGMSFKENFKMDTNAMASKWKGHDFTKKAIEKGEFDGQKRNNNWIEDELALRHVNCQSCEKK